MPYIHELTAWPTLTWDSDTLAGPLAAVRHEQGRLLGKMESLGFDLRSEASLIVLTADVVQSSAIEGETLNANEVRSSIARRLGLDAAGLPQPSRHVERRHRHPFAQRERIRDMPVRCKSSPAPSAKNASTSKPRPPNGSTRK